MNDKEALQEIVFMINDYVNMADHVPPVDFIENLITFLEENVVHCAIHNGHK